MTLRPMRTDFVGDVAHNSGAILKASAVAVLAAIAQRRQERVEKISVCGVNLEEAESCHQRSSRRVTECAHYSTNAVLVELLWDLMLAAEGNCAGREDWIPTTVRRSKRSAAKPRCSG